MVAQALLIPQEASMLPDAYSLQQHAKRHRFLKLKVAHPKNNLARRSTPLTPERSQL
ncbi:hypothetical protein D3C76_1545320 [compost metagenome]